VLKIIDVDFGDSPGTLDLLKAEAFPLTSLKHPNINRIINFDFADGRPYFVFEPLEGLRLSDCLEDVYKRGLALPLHIVARLFNLISPAIDYAHAHGVIHRDIKPAIIVLRHPSSPSLSPLSLLSVLNPCLTDFGIAHILQKAPQLIKGVNLGTSAYMSPEQAQGEVVDSRSDIFSLGAMLYELLTGSSPFITSDSHSPSAIPIKQIHEDPPPPANTTRSVAEVVLRALAKDPDQRYQRAVDLADAFEVAIGLEPSLFVPARDWTVSPQPPTLKMKMKAPRKPRGRIIVQVITIIFAIIVLAALGTLAYVAWRYISDLHLSSARMYPMPAASFLTSLLMGIPHDQIKEICS